MNIDEALQHLEIVLASVTKKDVKSSYRRLMLIWHPDKHTGAVAVEQATKKAQDLNNSYEALSRYFENQDTLANNQTTTSSPNPKDFDWAASQTPRANATSRSSSSSQKRRFWNDVVAHGFPDETVFEVFFESSHLVSAGYNVKSSILYQKFLESNGSTVVYRYFGVPATIWQNLQEAPSQGQYAIKHINYAFKYEKCLEKNRPYNPIWRLI